MDIKLKILDKDLSIVQLDEITDISSVFDKSNFVSLTKTDEEISLVTESKYVKDNWHANSGWKALFIVGPLDFSLVGILREVLVLLADGGVSIFAISTFDTDYILIKKEQLVSAVDILKQHFEFIPE